MPSTFLHIRPSTELNNFLFLAYIRTAANPQMRTSIPRDSPAQSTAIPSAGASMLTPATATARRIHPGMRDPSSAAGAAEDSERCCICLMGFVDRTAVGCGHEFCFKCIGVWTNQSRRCPLCNAEMGAYLEHDLDSSTPTKFFLPPLPQPFSTVRPPLSPTRKAAARAEVAALAFRRDIYARGLWAKHIATNGYTGFRANPSPRDMASDGASAGRARTFLRRELRVWYDGDSRPGTSGPGESSTSASPRGDLGDVERIADHMTALLSSVDIRSPVAVSLLQPLVGSYAHAQHLAHELYNFLRSPYAELGDYDAVASYDSEPAPPYAQVDRFTRRRDSLSSTVDSRDSRSFDSRSLSSRDSRDSRSRSRSRPPRRSTSASGTRGGDTFVPAPQRGERRWDQPDSWIDPSYEREMAAAEKRRKRKDQRTRQRERRREAEAEATAAAGGQAPSRKADNKQGATATVSRALAGAGITIRGAAERRQSLLERLAKAKGEAAVGGSVSGNTSPGSATGTGTALLARITGSPLGAPVPLPGDSDAKAEAGANDATVPATASDAGADVTPTSESAGTSANGSKRPDGRATELRARLIAERKRKVLREQLMARKRAKTSPEKHEGPEDRDQRQDQTQA